MAVSETVPMQSRYSFGRPREAGGVSKPRAVRISLAKLLAAAVAVQVAVGADVDHHVEDIMAAAEAAQQVVAAAARLQRPCRSLRRLRAALHEQTLFRRSRERPVGDRIEQRRDDFGERCR